MSGTARDAGSPKPSCAWVYGFRECALKRGHRGFHRDQLGAIWDSKGMVTVHDPTSSPVVAEARVSLVSEHVTATQLRDDLAKSAMEALIFANRLRKPEHIIKAKVAAEAYAWADAMLVARRVRRSY
jgi:hypothetical protein